MVKVPDALETLFTATIEEEAGRYVIEVPKREIDTDAVEPAAMYRVGVLSQPSVTTETDSESTAQPQPAGDESEPGPPKPPVSEGEVREVTIESIGDQGDGIAKVERGYVVIVPDGEPGDSPTVEVDTVRQNVAFASVVDSKPSVE